jgi:hypothetical protein
MACYPRFPFPHFTDSKDFALMLDSPVIIHGLNPWDKLIDITCHRMNYLIYCLNGCYSTGNGQQFPSGCLNGL